MFDLLPEELVIDNFAGGGGASDGIENALKEIGRHVDIAVNHDPEAIAMHAANHPFTRHLCENVWDVDIEKETKGRPVGLAWFSPDCKHFSKAKGGKPVEKKIRGLAWVALRWARKKKPRIICLENVEEFQDWGPLLDDDQPCPRRKGMTFKRWCTQFRNLGYNLEFRRIVAAKLGVPTIRKRLYIVARCDGKAIVWPEETHGPGLLPYRTAAECIDFSVPCPSIFLNKEEARELGVNRPLAENTLKRIAKGLKRYVFESANPFIVNMSHGGKVEPIDRPVSTIATEKGGCRAIVVPSLVSLTHHGSDRVEDVQDPFKTITGAQRGEKALVAYSLSSYYGDKREGDVRGCDMKSPLPTQPTENRHALVAAFLSRQFGGSVGSPADCPLGTTTAGGGGKSAIVTSNLIKLRGTCKDGQRTDKPMPAVSAQGMHVAEVRAFLIAYFGTDQDPVLTEPMHTITSKHRFGLVMVHGELYQIVDIGLRMLTPRELFRAQGFREDYIIDGGRDITSSNGILFPGAEWVPMTQTAQVRMVGNSVCPPVAEAIVRAQLGLSRARKMAA